MIFGQLPGKSPEKKSRNYIKSVSNTPLFHMNCLQLSRTKMVYDDIFYESLIVTRFILIAQIIYSQRVTSPRGIIMLNVKVQDSTGKWTICFYYSQQIKQICDKYGTYVKIAAHIKCAGLVYRPQIKTIGISIVPIQNFNEITYYNLECMKVVLRVQS